MNTLKFCVLASGQKFPIFALNRSFHISSALFNQTLYDVLQISHNATQSEIKDAYYKLSKVYHPDVKKDENSLAMFRKITEAYDVLGSIRTRLEYDNKVLGKYQPYDTSKSDFYSTLYRDNVVHGARRPEVNKILDKQSVVDQYLRDEYKDRLAEYRMSKNKQYLHYMNPFGEYGIERNIFVWFIAASFTMFKCFEYFNDW